MTRREGKQRRATIVFGFFDRLLGTVDREYRIKTHGSLFFAEYRDRFRWIPIPAFSHMDGTIYSCRSRAAALRLIQANKDQLTVLTTFEVVA